jgi:hypothetical protein
MREILAQLVVEVGERLVEQNEISALDQRAGDRGALLLAAGELQRRAIQIRRERQQLRRLAHPRFHLGLRPSLHP